MSNPYSLVFGIDPSEHISRISQTSTVQKGLETGDQRIFMVTGVRGSGKTVFMNDIKKIFSAKKDWIVIELSTERDMLTGLVAKLYSKNKLSGLFKNTSISLSALGIGVEINNRQELADTEVILGEMLESLKKKKRHLLVLADEAVDNEPVREFASVFQILIRDELPISLLMTGLYENIDDLQNVKNLTFLHRAPKVHLCPLSIGTMAASYRKNLEVDEDESIELARMTQGYSYAFQVLGHLLYENGGKVEEARVTLKQYLEEYVYDKIWSELSKKDKDIVYAISKTPSGKISDIRKFLKMDSNEFSPYKKRLLRKGLIANENGYARLVLPLFDEFARENI